MPVPLDARSFEERLRELLAASTSQGNEACIECRGCSASSHCTFCTDSDRLVRCHFCTRCVDCFECSHCRDSRGLVACQHCDDCEGCARSAYLVRSVGCSGCTYCFGCVGLSQRDFHILNEPYERSEYFAIIARLRRELGLPP
jgi:hypothetical protein